MNDDGRSDVPAPRSPSAPERRFREEEVSAILARASARESRAGLPAPHDPTLADLMAAAEEAGLDPAEVRRAAALVPRGGGGATGPLLGAPMTRDVFAFLPDARLPSDTMAVARALEGALGTSGKVKREAGHLTWRAEGVTNRGSLTVREHDGGVELSLTTDRAGNYMGLWFLGMVAWAIISALTPLGQLHLTGEVMGLLLAPLVLMRPVWTAMDRRWAKRVENAVLDVLRLADAEGPAALPEGEDDGA